METVIDEIRRAIGLLSLSPERVRELPTTESEAVFRAVVDRFVASGDRRWWWEDFRKSGVSAKFPDGDGWRHVVDIVPERHERVWFIVEECQLPHFPVYEATVHDAMTIVGECYGFEFYIVPKELNWLVCETHHGVVCAIGEAVEGRLLNQTSDSDS